MMDIPPNIYNAGVWLGYITIALMVVTAVAFIFKWSFRFRLVGATGFMAVLTGGVFSLGLGLQIKADIPGAINYSLVYDNGGNRTVITVPLQQITPETVEPTLEQAAFDLFSYGRAGGSNNNQMNIRLRTVLHPTPGVSVPLYLGQVERSLLKRQDDNMSIEVFKDNVARLPVKSTNQSNS